MPGSAPAPWSSATPNPPRARRAEQGLTGFPLPRGTTSQPDTAAEGTWGHVRTLHGTPSTVLLPGDAAVSPQHRCPTAKALGHRHARTGDNCLPGSITWWPKPSVGRDAVGPRQWVPAAAGEGGKLWRLWLNWNEARHRPAVPALGTLTPWAGEGS